MKIKKIVLGSVMTNCYIAWDERAKQGIVIDPADNSSKILKYINDEGIVIKYIILTHTHFDHIQATAEVSEATGAKIAIHNLDALGLTDERISLGAGTGYGKAQKPADILLNDGDVLKIDNIEFKIIHTPGHTVGGICILAENVLFSGDTLFEGDVGRCDLPGGNLDVLIKSLNEKLMVLNDNVTVYPGHGGATTIGNERLNNPYI